MKKKFCLAFHIGILSLLSLAEAAIYECKYKERNQIDIISFYNTFGKKKENHDKLIGAHRSGNCRELIVKKYFINGVACNIQFYKHTGKIARINCRNNDPHARKELRKIARKEYGYIGN